jgi:hypothetical protein
MSAASLESLARFVICPTLAIALSNCGRRLLPRGVRDMSDRSNSFRLVHGSSALMPLLNDGGETPQRRAARVKLRSLHSVTKYRI